MVTKELTKKSYEVTSGDDGNILHVGAVVIT